MISWEDVYKVAAAMAPLYVALVFGYCSAKFWRIFDTNHCHAINKFNFYFVLPFFTFHFTSTINPYNMNYRVLIADVIAKAITGATIALWANLWQGGNFPWAITSLSLSCFNNTLVVGVPLLESMYGELGEALVVQCSVLQYLLWFPLLLFLLEFWQCSTNSDPDQQQQQPPRRQLSSMAAEARTTSARHEQFSSMAAEARTTSARHEQLSSMAAEASTSARHELQEDRQQLPSPKVPSTLKRVFKKLGKNPNSYSCVLGIIWALIAKRWDFKMPSIMEGSIMIMAEGGSGISMFSVGLFIGLQERVLACGVRLTAYSMVLRFVAAPLTMAVGCLALRLPSNILRIAIIQAALPQAVNTFVYAQEYGLHANVLSTALTLGTILALPLLIAYYAILDIFH